MTSHKPIQDIKQNFWTLASIQCGSMGIWGMILGWQLAEKYGPNITIGSILIGNLILWAIGIVIISMSAHSRTNSIQNIKETLGSGSAIIATICLVLAFLSWYIYQLKASTIAFDNIFNRSIIEQTKISIRSGVGLGIFSALLAIGGIKIVKWINLICLPLLIIYNLAAFFLADNLIFLDHHWKLSLPVISAIVLFYLAGTINLPTFFRHSRSLADSYLALTLMTFIYSFFLVSSMFFNIQKNVTPNFIPVIQLGSYFQYIVVAFVILITIANLVVNIYFASASWEFSLPRFEGPKEYAIIGLIGTAAYTFVQISTPMKYILDLANFFLANLGLVLLLTFLLKIVFKRKIKILGKVIGTSAWILSCIAAVIFEFKFPNNEAHTLIVSMGVSSIFFLCAIFVEETIWATKSLLQRKRKKENA